MKALVWTRQFETGHPNIDAQHRRLVDLLGELSDALTEGDFDPDGNRRVFAELQAYASYHFAEEEYLMVKMGIDPRHLDMQRREHRFFAEELASMPATLDPRNHETATRLLEFLLYWTAYHILGTDQSMAKQLAAIERGEEAQLAYEQHHTKADFSAEPLLSALNGLFSMVADRNKVLREKIAELELETTTLEGRLARANQRLEALGCAPF